MIDYEEQEWEVKTINDVQYVTALTKDEAINNACALFDWNESDIISCILS